MKKNKWMVAFLVGGATLLAVGCEREQSVETGGIPGSRVIFSALTSYENSDATRTEYSGIVFGPSELTGTTNQVERIDWVSNDTHKDKFTVNYVAGTALNNSADYVVSSVNEENYNSRAGVVEADRSHILEWAGGSEHKFYAMYPTNTVNSDARLTVNRFQGVLYPSQPQTHTQSVKAADGTGPSWTRRLPNMDYAYMVAYAGTDNGMISGNSVTLPFRPAVTTFEFRLRRNAGEGGANIRYFKMISETAGDRTAKALTGQYSFDITSGDARGALWAGDAAVTVPAVTDANRVITVDFGEEGAVLPEASTTDYLDFTIFALPVSYNNLKIQLIDVNEKTREVALNDKSTGQGHAFQGGKKYVITNSSVPGEWIYVIEEIPDIVGYGHNPMLNKPFSVKSYKYTKTDEHGVPTQVFPVAWKTQYTLDGETWIDLTSDGVNIPGPDGKWNATFKTDNLTGDGIVALVDTEDRTASIEGIAQGTIEGDEAAAAQRAKLATHALRGTSTNPFDLSIHPSYGIDIDQETTRTTANCYIISAPGVYMFPCVYGNAITKGLENKSAYWPAAATDAAIIDDAGVSTLDQVNTVYNTDDAGWRAYTPRFYNAINREIASPYILEDITVTGKNAAVIWQDTEEGHEIVPFDEGNVGIIQKSIGGKTVDFIWFKVEPDNIKPGNFVIALRGSVPGFLSETWNILWSWHIWVTADDLTPQTLGNYEVMPRNIGWFDSNNGSSVQWPIRQIQYRVIQVEEDPKGQLDEEPFLVKQIGEAESTEPSVGGNVYYQWGRKDPFLPSTPDNKNHVWSYNHDYEGKFTMEGSGILKKDLNADYLDYGAGIREPFNPFSNVVSLGSIGGPAYPLQRALTPKWWIKSEYEVRGCFNLIKATNLNLAGYAAPADWTVLVPGYNYVSLPLFMPKGPYTDAEKNTLVTTDAIGDSDFEQKADGWYLIMRKIGPFSDAEKDMINSNVPKFTGNGLTGWLKPEANYFYLAEDKEFNFGPYTDTQKAYLEEAGFTVEGGWIEQRNAGGLAPYPASMRSKASNPSNLWNSYIYDEQTAGPSDVNKFKTIYDPCPPGFTVPSKQVFIGTLPADQMVRDYHTGTGKPLTKEVPNPVTDIFPGLTKQLLNSGDVNDKKGMDVAGVFLPYTGARIFRFDDYVPGSYNGTTGHPTVLYAEGVGSCGYYWTDNPLKIEYRDLDANPKDYTNIRLHWFYFDGYALIFGEDTDGYITNDWNFQSYSRPTAFSIRPMKDPKVSY